MFAKYLAVFLLLSVSAFAAEPPKTIELPTALIQRVMQSLVIEEGATSSALLRAINDCVQVQVAPRDKTQPDRCPAVTEAIAARAKPTDKAP